MTLVLLRQKARQQQRQQQQHGDNRNQRPWLNLDQVGIGLVGVLFGFRHVIPIFFSYGYTSILSTQRSEA